MKKNNENKIFGKKNIPSANNKGIKMNTNKKGEYTQNTTPKNNKKVVTKSCSTSNLAKGNNRYKTNIKKENNNNNEIRPSNLFTNKGEILNTNININEKLNSIQQLFEGKLDGFMEKINEKFNNIEKEYNIIIKQNTKILNYNKVLNENFENLQKETSKNLLEFQNQLKKNNEKDLSPEIIKLQEKEKKYQNDIYYYKDENEKLNEQIKILKEENNNLKKEIENKETKMTENDFGNKTYYNSKINVHRSIETKMVFDVLNIDKNNNINSVENKEYILIGLKPIKEIPFLNCVIQCLNQTELLTNYILNNNNINNNLNLSSELKLIFQQFSTQDRKIIDLHKLSEVLQKIQSLKTSNINCFRNIYKFLNFFLYQLHEELISDLTPSYNFIFENRNEIQHFKKSIENQNSKIGEIFNIFCENFIQCSKEKIKTDYQFKPSLFLYFELSKSKYNNRDEIPLEECLRIRREKYVSSSKNEFCKSCKENCYVLHYRRFLFSKIIIIMFCYDENENQVMKLNFKKQIDLANYTKLPENDNNKNKLIYNLYGIITLVKDNSEDKYLALCKNKENNNWYRFDDENIYYINDVENDIINYGKPLILFYNKA